MADKNMRSIFKYSLHEWISLKPFAFFLKQIRNNIYLVIYCLIGAKEEEKFVNQLLGLKNKNVICVVAFEQLQALDWCLSSCQRYLNDWQILVFDNSRNLALRDSLADLCAGHDVPYLSLPYNFSRHPNRSHGMAMTWIYRRIIRRINPRYFGFLDHDMILTKKINLLNEVSGQICYGLRNGKSKDYWNLWAGYCFYEFKKVAKLNLNFLYDFSRGLDTGGRNWKCLYKNLKETSLKFAGVNYLDVTLSNLSSAKIQLIGDCWVHIGGVGYKDNFQKKGPFFEKLAPEILGGNFFKLVRLD